jgi:hypothetical protein
LRPGAIIRVPLRDVLTQNMLTQNMLTQNMLTETHNGPPKESVVSVERVKVIETS